MSLAAKPTPDRRTLRALFDYDPVVGVLIWKPRARRYFSDATSWKMWNTRFAGVAAGSIRKDGYVAIEIPQGRFLAHRIVWKLLYGKDATSLIDHVNRRRYDNCAKNLRLAGDDSNQWNAKRRSDNTSGVKGVSMHEGKWRARIQVAGKPIFLGHFPNRESAETAVKSARVKLHKQFARHR